MAEEAGEVVACPKCGTDVKQKSMIPVLGDGGKGHRYLCRECARALIPDEQGEAPESGEQAAPTAGAAQQPD